MEIPETFTERLEQEFGGRLRIRWSPSEYRFRIEQKVARAIMWPDRPVLENDDDLQCVKDGYFHVLSVTPGDKMKCKVCAAPIPVPVGEMQMVHCPTCKAMGRQMRYAVAFFPLNDMLIEHLKKIDPERNLARDTVAELNARNEAAVQRAQRAIQTQAEAYVDDNFNRIVGIPQTGYTGRERMWDDAPKKVITNELQKVPHGQEVVGV